VLHFKDKNLS